LKRSRHWRISGRPSISDKGEPVTNDDLGFLSAIELRALYRSRQLSPVEVTTAILERMERLEPKVNAFVTKTPELAIEHAKAAERAYADGAAGSLAGIPVSIKDLSTTKGIRTTKGSLLTADLIPDDDAPFVERVYAKGAVMLGKTNTPEFGWKGDSGNRVVGPSYNPWKLSQTAGGSSGGGAAAAAAGYGPLHQGSDGAGSIRIPCSFCGVYGLKPSLGLIPQYPPSAMCDLSHMGPMTRTVADSALLLTETAGADARDRFSWTSGIDYLATLDDLDLHGKRIAWSPDLGYAPVEPEVRTIAEAAAKRFLELGCSVEEVNPGLPNPWDIVDTIWASATAGAHLDDLDQVRDRLDPGRLGVAISGQRFTGPQLANALSRRNSYVLAMREFFLHYDYLLTPTLPCTAFKAGDDHPGEINGVKTNYLGWTAFTYPFNLSGYPAATVPCGFASDGLPVGLQIVGRWRDDVSVLRASAAFEALAPWSHHRPAL
jgi:aspartyl-tRNA(Asn)/glutamyl-tRNA(Gln) amidotransferase subunit A